MSGGLEDIAIWLTIGGALINVGVTLGALPRLSRDLDDHKKQHRDELDKLWHRDELCTLDRRRLSERISGWIRPRHGEDV